MRWKAEWSIYGKLCQEYSYQKLSKSDNWFLSYSQKCWGCFFGTQCIIVIWSKKLHCLKWNRCIFLLLEWTEFQSKLLSWTILWYCPLFGGKARQFIWTHASDLVCCIMWRIFCCMSHDRWRWNIRCKDIESLRISFVCRLRGMSSCSWNLPMYRCFLMFVFLTLVTCWLDVMDNIVLFFYLRNFWLGMYRVGQKKCATLLLSISLPFIDRFIDQNSFTGTLCRHFAIMWLL